MESQPLCLVLGANGFVGSHLVDELAENGFRVRAFDLYTQPAQFKENQNVTVMKGDLFDSNDIDKALEGVAYVFHSFSLTTPYSSDDDPYTDIDKNLKPSVKIFEQCIEARVKKVIFISSGGAIYGHIAEEKPVTEDDAATPVSPYGINKLAIENYLAYFNRKFDLDYLVYRLTNPYGPRQVFRNNQGVIPAFLQQIEEHDAVTVFGDGSASRDYVYIRDVTKMMTHSFAKEARFRTYNLGSGKQTSLNDIISALKNVTQKTFSVEHRPAPKTFLKRADISVERFVQEFGEHATTDLAAGLKQMLSLN